MTDAAISEGAISFDAQSISSTSNVAETELHLAASCGDIEVLKLLDSRNVDMNAKNQRGDTALHCAVEAGQLEVVIFLAEGRVNLNTKNSDGDTALHLAAGLRDSHAVQLLVTAGADVNSPDARGRTTLHVACMKRAVDCALCLLNAECLLDVIDDDNETALHKACREDLMSVVQAMCAYGCQVDIINRSGLTALHIAARVGDPEVIRCLLLSGADPDTPNKDGIRAEDIAQGQGRTEVADLLAKVNASAMHGKHDPYIKQLMPSERALSRIKLKIFGNCCVGKTALVNSLKCGYIRGFFRTLSSSSSSVSNGSSVGRRSASPVDLENGIGTSDTPDHDGCTRCIDVQHVNISGAGDMSVWEFSGHDSYYSVYDHFVGDPNCIHIVVFNADDPTETQKQQLHFWLDFLRARIAPAEPIGFAGTQLWAPRVLLVATHIDVTSPVRRNSRGEAELVDGSSLITSLQTSFGAELLIVPRVYAVDARQPSSVDIKALRSAIADMKQFLCQYLPPSLGFLDATVSTLPAWTRVLGGYPVVRWFTFVEYIRSRVNILATEQHLQDLVCQLQLMGEVVYVETDNEDLIVLNPRWLCSDILARLLGPNNNKQLLQQQQSDGRLTSSDLTRIFPELDTADIMTLLIGLEVCGVVPAENGIGNRFHCSGRNHMCAPPDDKIYRSYVQNLGESPLKSTVCGGVALRSIEGFPRQLRHIFPRVQQALWNSQVVSLAGNAMPMEWSGKSIIISGGKNSERKNAVCVRLSEDRTYIRVECRGSDAGLLFELQEAAVALVLRIVESGCPGLYLERAPLCPRDIRSCRIPPRIYSPRDIINAQLQDTPNVQLDDSDDTETLVDVLAFGSAEIYSNLQTGINLHVSNLSMYARCRLASLLDPPHPLGRDWCLLALSLGLGDSVPCVDATETVTLSRTDAVLALWSRDPSATIRRLYESIRNNVQRKDVEMTLLSLTPLVRIEVSDRATITSSLERLNTIIVHNNANIGNAQHQKGNSATSNHNHHASSGILDSALALKVPRPFREMSSAAGLTV